MEEIVNSSPSFLPPPPLSTTTATGSAFSIKSERDQLGTSSSTILAHEVVVLHQVAAGKSSCDILNSYYPLMNMVKH